MWRNINNTGSVISVSSVIYLSYLNIFLIQKLARQVWLNARSLCMILFGYNMIMRWLCALRMHCRCIVVYRSLTWICCIFQIMKQKCFLCPCFLNNWTPLCYVMPGYWFSRFSVIRYWFKRTRYQLLDPYSFRSWYSKYSTKAVQWQIYNNTLCLNNKYWKAPMPIILYWGKCDIVMSIT